MICIGKVTADKVLLPPGIHLPDGTEVEVRVAEPSAPSGSFAEKFSDFIGMADDLPPDLAQNLDHYLHGHAKK